MYTMSKNVGCNESHPSLLWTRDTRHVRIEVEKERRGEGAPQVDNNILCAANEKPHFSPPSEHLDSPMLMKSSRNIP